MSEETTTEILVLADLAAELMAAKAAKKKAEEAESKANEEIAWIEMKLVEQMALQEIEKFAAHGQLFFPIVQSFPAVDKEVEGRFIEWLQERNEDGIYKLTVHPQTLKAFYNQHDEWHEELTAFLKVHEKIRIGVRSTPNK